ELAPFQVIVGPNGAGKSNLFDALKLLSRLAEMDLQMAFQPPHDDPQKPRGDAYELFTLFPNGERVERMRFAVEMLVDQKVQDDLGGEYKLTYRRLRYELEITLTNNRLRLHHEALKAIPSDKDNWCKKHALFFQNNSSAKTANE